MPASEAEYGPGKNGWPAHGYSDTRFGKLRCYCDEDFANKMSLNRHVEAEVLAAATERVGALDVERLVAALLRIHSWELTTAIHEAADIAAEYAALGRKEAEHGNDARA